MTFRQRNHQRKAGIRNAARANRSENNREVIVQGVRPAGHESLILVPTIVKPSVAKYSYSADTADPFHVDAENRALFFIIMGKPRTKMSSNIGRNGGRYSKSSIYMREFASVVRNLLMHKIGHIPDWFLGRDDVLVEFTYVYKTPRSDTARLATVGDLDNLCKFTCDALDHLKLYTDDSAISSISVKKRFAKKMNRFKKYTEHGATFVRMSIDNFADEELMR